MRLRRKASERRRSYTLDRVRRLKSCRTPHAAISSLSQPGLATAIEQSPVAVIITDVNGTIEYVNHQASALSGYSSEELVGKNPRLLKSGKTPAADYEELWRTITSGATWSGELFNRRKDGSLYWQQTTIAPVIGPSGGPSRFVGLQWDVTEHRSLVSRLQDTTRRYSTLFDQSVDAIVVHDLKGRILEANRAMAALTGYSVAELTRMKVGDVDVHFGASPPPDLDISGVPLDEERPRIMDVESELRRKDGRKIPVEVRLTVMPLSNENVVLAVSRDISRRRKAENALRESESRYRMLFDDAPIGILYCDRDGSVRNANAECRRILTMHPDATLVDALANCGLSEQLLQTMEEGSRRSGQVGDSCQADGEGRVLQYMISPVLGSEGEIAGAQMVLEDVTEENRSRRRLQESLRESEILLKEIHHRVKNNLQTVSSMLHMQASEVEGSAAHTALLDSVTRVHSMAMVHEQLYVSDSFERIAFDSYLRDLVGQIRSFGSDGSTQLYCSFNLESIELNIDQALPLGLIANEALSNAVKHAGGDTDSVHVRIGLEATANRLTMTIHDDGPGIDARISGEAASAPGSGLGLHLIDALSRQLDADLQLESSAGLRLSVSLALR